MRLLVTTLALALLPGAARAGAASEAVLPPLPPWSGRSRALALPPEHAWATPFEKSDLTRTPRYDETAAYLRRLVEASPELRLLSLGRSPEGREIWMVVAARGGAATPEALRAAGRPTLLVQAGIHAGEIDGKDAGLMLLRDVAVLKTKADLLDAANLLFVPIFNVDGHERFSRYARINQRGPLESGWRTTARNLNLNRDYAKLDCPETRAMVRALEAWNPDLYVDVHVTDGADYQYDVTFGHNGTDGHSPAIGRWLEETITPALARALEAMGHLPGPLTQFVDDKDPLRGIVAWTAGPRFSTGYGDARHLPTLLVENHSLKPFAQRVLGTYVLLEAAMRTLGTEAGRLRAAVTADRARRPAEVALDWKQAETPAGAVRGFKAVAWRLRPSAITGEAEIEWLGSPTSFDAPRWGMRPAATAPRARAYWIPPAWPELVERLEAHGIRVERVPEARELPVEMYRLLDPKPGEPFEGHVPVGAGLRVETRTERFPAGSARVSTDQPLGDLAALLLEPASPDSFFQWGFFLEVLQPTEYVEGYVMEPMAEQMLAADPALRAEFERTLAADPAFAKDPRARLQWFYRRTPFFDERYGLYPVAREP